MIGVLSTVMLGSLGLFGRMIRSDIDALNQKIDGVEHRLDTKIDTKFDGLSAVMDARFNDVNHRLDAIQADMHLVKSHLFGKISA